MQQEALELRGLGRKLPYKFDNTFVGPGYYSLPPRSYSQMGRFRGSSMKLEELRSSSIGPGSYDVRTPRSRSSGHKIQTGSYNFGEHKCETRNVDVDVERSFRYLTPVKMNIEWKRMAKMEAYTNQQDFDLHNFPAPCDYHVVCDRRGKASFPVI